MAFRDALRRGVADIAMDAHEALHAHITKHSIPPEVSDKPVLSHEEWIEAGLRYQVSEHCIFCGQFLSDNTLVKTYKVFFGAQYKDLATDIRQRRATLQRYLNGDFRRQLQDRLRENEARSLTWQALAGVRTPAFDQNRIEALLLGMEESLGQ